MQYRNAIIAYWVVVVVVVRLWSCWWQSVCQVVFISCHLLLVCDLFLSLLHLAFCCQVLTECIHCLRGCLFQITAGIVWAGLLSIMSALSGNHICLKMSYALSLRWSMDYSHLCIHCLQLFSVQDRACLELLFHVDSLICWAVIGGQKRWSPANHWSTALVDWINITFSCLFAFYLFCS